MMSEPYRSASPFAHLQPETKGLPIARLDPGPSTEESVLPIRLRANTNVTSSRPAYYRVSARSWTHLVEWASQRTDFDGSQDFFRYQDEHGLDVFLTDESDFHEAIIALQSMQSSRSDFQFPDKDPSPLPVQQSPQPPSPRGDRLELWIVKKQNTTEFLYRCSESIQDIARFVNDNAPSSVRRIHGFLEFRSRTRRFGSNLLIAPDTIRMPISEMAEEKQGVLPEMIGDEPVYHLSNSSDDDRVNLSMSRSASPKASSLMITRTDASEDRKSEDNSIFYHIWTPRDESSVKYRFRIGSFDAQFGSRDSVDLKLFPQLCIGMIPVAAGHLFERVAFGVSTADLCIFVEEISESEIGRGSFPSGLLAGYGVEEEIVEDRSTLHPKRPESASELPYIPRRMHSAPPQSMFPPKLGKLPSTNSVFAEQEEPVFKGTI